MAAVRFIRNHLTEKITVNCLAKECGMSESSFYQSFRSAFGITPLSYVLKARIAYAKKLMADPQLTICEISYASGFNNVNHFINMFKKVENVTPGKYRR